MRAPVARCLNCDDKPTRAPVAGWAYRIFCSARCGADYAIKACMHYVWCVACSRGGCWHDEIEAEFCEQEQKRNAQPVDSSSAETGGA